MSLKSLGEFGFIRAMRARHPATVPGSPLRLGVGDDACVLKPSPGCELLATCDMLIEGVHFDLATTGPWQLGAKSLAASLSDIAAMGGLPRAYLVSLSIPKRKGLDERFFAAFYDGLAAWGLSFGAELAGGDTTRSPGPLVVDITCLGEAEAGRALTRGGAKPGDKVYVTGELGGSAAGLACLQAPRAKVNADARALCEQRHLLPQPRYLAGRWLLDRRAATSCIDISDGLASEAGHLCAMSRVGMRLQARAIPLHAGACVAAATLRRRALDWALYGGEDYELLFTVPKALASQVESLLPQQTGTAVTCIGQVLSRRAGLSLQDGRRRLSLRAGGYNHFRD
jgi:thiamine-monophosphate kinase